MNEQSLKHQSKMVESARSMLLDANLSKSYWAATAVYLRNRCPTKAVLRMTPFEAWHGGVDHLRVFGCDSYAHIPKDECGKLEKMYPSWLWRRNQRI